MFPKDNEYRLLGLRNGLDVLELLDRQQLEKMELSVVRKGN